MQLDVGIGRQRREEMQREHQEGRRGQIGLDAVPRHRDQAADHRRNIGAEHAERGPADHRIRGAGDLARLGHQIAEELHDDDADQQRDQHLPAGQAQREQAAGRDVAADAVHVRHPEREDVVGAPGLLLQRRQVFVGQPFVIRWLDQRVAMVDGRAVLQLGGGRRGGVHHACLLKAMPCGGRRAEGAGWAVWIEGSGIRSQDLFCRQNCLQNRL